MRLLTLLDDTPVVPGDIRPAYEHSAQARQILNDAEDDLRDWRPETGAEGESQTLSPRQQQKSSTDSYSQGIGPDGFAARASEDQDTEYVRDNTQNVREIPDTSARTYSGTQGVSNRDLTAAAATPV